ncbi:MAG: transcriptional regulator BetI, partial [Proteobacteria bacterium]|nr:transcriptional regulator BetI [Pseudomonadota bacterium]
MNNQSNRGPGESDTGRSATDRPEEDRREQLVEVAIDCLAELGYVGSTLAQIAGRAGVSAGLIAHYFGDKDGLLEAAFRHLSRRVHSNVRAKLRLARTPRGRVQAIIDANLAPEEFNQRTGNAWLAFWGQLLHVERLKRVQTAYQQRMLSNLRHALRPLVGAEEATALAAMIAAMIDGVWLRAALSNWREADSEGARGLLTAFVEGRLRERAPPPVVAPAEPRP